MTTPNSTPTRAARWHDSLTDLVAWRDAHGRWPSSEAKDPTERRLGIWALNVRRHYRVGRLTPERIAALEAIPGWVWRVRISNRVWPAVLTELVAWRDKNGQWPRMRGAADPVEGRLGHWLSAQRVAYNEGTLSPERVAALEAIPGWVWRVRASRSSGA